MNHRRFLFLAFAICWLAPVAASHAEVRIKDITRVAGVRGNFLYGQGLVMGLDNTGAKSLATQQVAIDMLRKLEMTSLLARQTQFDNVFKSTSLALVMVTAELPPFAREGSKIDITASVIDDSSSLQGGVLLSTPLRSFDGQVYAVAQGSLSVGGFAVRSNIQGAQKNQMNVAKGLDLGIVEKEALSQLDQSGIVRFTLNTPDSATAKSIMLAINRKYPATARTIDPGAIQIRVPLERRSSISDFIGEIGQITVMPDVLAKIVINERTGTVVVGNNVRISAVQIAHGNLSIKPNTSLIPAAQPAPVDDQPGAPPSEDPIEDILKKLRPGKLPNSDEDKQPIMLHEVEQTFTVADLARVLNALGVSPRDLIAIFQNLQRTGALHAEIEVI